VEGEFGLRRAHGEAGEVVDDPQVEMHIGTQFALECSVQLGARRSLSMRAAETKMTRLAAVQAL
jgi:hypothetical protein